MEKIPLIAIVGPTAVGKTALSIDLAKEFDCEGPRGRIDILDLSLSLSLGLAEFYIGRCRRDTNPSSVRLDIVEMDMVASCRIFMVCCFDRDFITTV